jgi:hypothetical protein
VGKKGRKNEEKGKKERMVEKEGRDSGDHKLVPPQSKP